MQHTNPAVAVVRRGFTLIELLVVIAIIGILSAVVLVSLSTARNKGNDAAVQSNLSTIQTQAELYYANNNSYGAANTGAPSLARCSTSGSLYASDPTIGNAIASAKNSAKGNTILCNSSASTYLVTALVNGTTTAPTYWCVDSTGVAKYESAAPGNVTACL